ncbi:MAG: ribose-5-phosphate isomerase RpiA [Planctomycetes bacterium]|nr:ribose-5-phosphate isomerase RpiA [Planctomycetota bacterium]
MEARRRVGVAAAALVENGMVVGLGTGSTAACAIAELGRRVREDGLRFIGVPTSWSAAELARQAGLDLRTLNDVDRVDIALDGADEVGPGLALIKGGGAAHTQEKIVATAARRFVVLADDGKLVDVLGVKWAVPVEVLGFALKAVERTLVAMGSVPVLRKGGGKDGPVVTDHGNLVLDAKFESIPDPAALARVLDAIPGVLEHGLFVDLADEALIGSRVDGSVRRIS